MVNMPHIMRRLMPNCQFEMGYERALVTSLGSEDLVSSSFWW